MEVINHFWADSREIKGLLEGHPQGLNEPVFEEDHERWLTKCIADKFFTLRLFTYGKKNCQKVIQTGQGSERQIFMQKLMAVLLVTFLKKISKRILLY